VVPPRESATTGRFHGIDVLDEDNHTVSGLARELKIGKPAVTRALDRLEELDLARRVVDPGDRRRIWQFLLEKFGRLSDMLRKIDANAAKRPTLERSPVHQHRARHDRHPVSR
jgi:DNA-binding MarR family transcriptional regulator